MWSLPNEFFRKLLALSWYLFSANDLVSVVTVQGDGSVRKYTRLEIAVNSE